MSYARKYIRAFTDLITETADLTDAEFRLYVTLQLEAAMQVPAGRFRTLDILRAYSPPNRRRHLKRLVELGYLVPLSTGEVYVDGWAEAQEGNWQVAERVARYRARRRGLGPPPPEDVTAETVKAAGTIPSGNGREAHRDDVTQGVRALRV